MSTIKRLAFAFLAALCLSACNKAHTEAPTVNLAIWGNYLSKQTEKRFTEVTGIRLNVMNYSSNEELLAKIQSGEAGIDVAVPSDYMVDIMAKLSLLEPLKKDQLTSFKHLSKDLLQQPFDPENRYSLPYAWSLSGIAVNRSLFKDPIVSWRDFLENPKLAGKISLLDDVREVTGAILKMQGKSVNTIKEDDLKEARAELLKIKPNIKMFTSDTVDALKNKEVLAAQSYSPDALQAAAQSSSRIEFIVPKEGSTRSIDNLVILKGATHPAAALKLIDFLLQKENSIEFVKTIRAGPVVDGVKSALPFDLQSSLALFPTPATLATLERIHDLGDHNHLYEEIWTAVKSSE